MIELPPVNILAAIVAAAAVFLIGGLYWAVFTPAWSRRLGTPPEDARPTPARLGVAFVTRVVVAFILAVFVGWTGAQGAGGGAEIGFLAWLGFVVPPALARRRSSESPGRSWRSGCPSRSSGSW